MIKKLIDGWAPALQTELCKPAVLWAIYRCEMYPKGTHVPRFEPAYAPGGHYYERSPALQEEYRKWGDTACCSYSNFQILYPTARELGYQGPPLGLDKDAVALPFVVEYLNRRVFGRGASTPEEVADAYNSGSFADNRKPFEYMKRFLYFYQKYTRECTESTSKDNASSIEQPA